MTYVCELSNGQRLYLDNQGSQTLITLASSSAGQQQQSSQGIQTGEWTALPEVFHVEGGFVVKLKTARGERFVEIQGSSLGMLSGSPTLSNAQQIQMQQTSNVPSTPVMKPMKSMKPMKPMQMGNMQMNLNPMEMRIGDMVMRMPAADAAPAEPAVRRFCSQCGTPVQSSDRFCASCGHRLTSS